MKTIRIVCNALQLVGFILIISFIFGKVELNLLTRILIVLSGIAPIVKLFTYKKEEFNVMYTLYSIMGLGIAIFFTFVL